MADRPVDPVAFVETAIQERLVREVPSEVEADAIRRDHGKSLLERYCRRFEVHGSWKHPGL